MFFYLTDKHRPEALSIFIFFLQVIAISAVYPAHVIDY
jgi:hypothetical protein